MDESSIGYLAAFVAVICFGSNFVPIKRVDIGDGVFFQFIMCNAIFITSFPVLIIQNFPQFHALAMLGGFLWCTGNMLCGPIIQLIGMSMGLLLWGSTNMLMGWASGTFGLFGLTREDIKHPALNYLGIALALVGLVIYLQVKSTSKESKDSNYAVNMSNDNYIQLPQTENSLHDKLISHRLQNGVPVAITITPRNSTDFHSNAYHVETANTNNKTDNMQNNDIGTFGSSWSPTTRRSVGLFMACFTGILFGCSFDPAQYVIDHDYDGSDDSLNYVFPHYCGILLSSWIYTILYTLYLNSKNQDLYINPKCIIPASISGVLWGIAEIAWFVANGRLGFSVSFPLITSGPGFVGALWGIFYFKEISGTRNLAVLACAFMVTVPALIIISLAH